MVLTASYVPSQRINGEVEHKNKPRTSEGTGRDSQESPQIYKFISLVSHQGVNTVHSPVFS